MSPIAQFDCDITKSPNQCANNNENFSNDGNNGGVFVEGLWHPRKGLEGENAFRNDHRFYIFGIPDSRFHPGGFDYRCQFTGTVFRNLIYFC